MTKEGMKTSFDKQLSKGNSDYIELWFQAAITTIVLHSPTFLSTMRVVDSSYFGIYQSIILKLEYECICTFVMHIAPLEIFLHLRKGFLFQVGYDNLEK